MGQIIVYEDVSVAATFINQTTIPREIYHHGQWHKVAKIEKSWTGIEAYQHLHYWEVEACGQWRLCFNARECSWMAEELPQNCGR